MTKVCELQGDDLDYWVAQALGYTVDGTAECYGYIRWRTPENEVLCYAFCPSTSWTQAGSIIQGENISLSPPTSMVHRHGGPNAGWGPSGMWSACTWHTGANGRRSFAWHETDPLVAVMRAFVASKFGDEVPLLGQGLSQGEQG